MARWFRFYSGVVDDPKAQMLAPELFKHWVNVLCIAAQHDGELPAIDVTAFMLGRMSTAKAAEILAKLHKADLLDKTEKSFKPHNWDARQYKQDKTDGTNAERQRRYRDRNRNAESNGVTAVTEKRISEGTECSDDDDADDARARSSAIGRQAFELTEQLLELAGHSRAAWPPGWCGAPLRVKAWLEEGWEPEVIKAAVRGAAARKRGPPAHSIQFFENAVAEEVARQAAPLPKVEIREAETITVKANVRPKSAVIQAADDLCERLASFDGPARTGDNLRGGEGETSPRLLSHG